MRLLEITVSELQRAHRVAYALLPPGADPVPVGSQVVVLDQAGQHYAAYVVSSETNDAGAWAHQLRLGVALPPAVARRRLARSGTAEAPRTALVHEIQDYLTTRRAVRDEPTH